MGKNTNWNRSTRKGTQSLAVENRYPGSARQTLRKLASGGAVKLTSTDLSNLADAFLGLKELEKLEGRKLSYQGKFRGGDNKKDSRYS